MRIDSNGTSTPRRGVLIYAQHLLGTGHLKRAALLARALAAAGMRVELVSGGMPVPHLPFPVHQLPPARCAADDFTVLIDESGAPVSDGWRSRRRDCLIHRFDKFRPDVLILETFPFGRRQMEFELLPLLDMARSAHRRPLIISSVRDVLQKRRPHRVAEAVAVVNQYFDRVFVHGDPAFIGLEESFPMANEIRGKIVYTGYIADQDETDPSTDTNGNDEVLVSAGGGAVSGRLMLTALEARPQSRLKMLRWRFLIGSGLPGRDLRSIESHASGDVVVEAARADFPALLRRCAVSVSQGGYNTVVDLLRTRARSVIVPYAGGGETEQSFRARHLHQRGYALTVDESTLTPSVLAEAIDLASNTTPAPALVDLDGASKSANYITEALKAGAEC